MRDPPRRHGGWARQPWARDLGLYTLPFPVCSGHLEDYRRKLEAGLLLTPSSEDLPLLPPASLPELPMASRTQVFVPLWENKPSPGFEGQTLQTHGHMDSRSGLNKMERGWGSQSVQIAAGKEINK